MRVIETDNVDHALDMYPDCHRRNGLRHIWVENIGPLLRFAKQLICSAINSRRCTRKSSTSVYQTWQSSDRHPRAPEARNEDIRRR